MGKSYREPGRYNKERRLHNAPARRDKPVKPQEAQAAYHREEDEWIDYQLNQEDEYADH